MIIKGTQGRRRHPHGLRGWFHQGRRGASLQQILIVILIITIIIHSSLILNDNNNMSEDLRASERFRLELRSSLCARREPGGICAAGLSRQAVSTDSRWLVSMHGGSLMQLRAEGLSNYDNWNCQTNIMI